MTTPLLDQPADRAQLPKGKFVLVPREYTEEMLERAVEAIDQHRKSVGDRFASSEALAGIAYDLMISAAPPAPVAHSSEPEQKLPAALSEAVSLLREYENVTEHISVDLHKRCQRLLAKYPVPNLHDWLQTPEGLRVIEEAEVAAEEHFAEPAQGMASSPVAWSSAVRALERARGAIVALAGRKPVRDLDETLAEIQDVINATPPLPPSPQSSKQDACWRQAIEELVATKGWYSDSNIVDQITRRAHELAQSANPVQRRNRFCVEE